MRNILIIGSIAAFTLITIILISTHNEITIDVIDGQLKGTLKTVGNEHDTVVLLIAGSGPTDRNGNSSVLDGRNDSLLQLSMSLNKYGLDTFRYDKRTAGESVDLCTANISFDCFVNDLISCIDWLKSENYNKIYLAGHSQGSLLAILAAQQRDVAGIISISGTARTIDQTFEEQLTAQGHGEIAKAIFDKLRNNELVTELQEEWALPFSLDNQRFLLEWMTYDPMQELQGLDIPILFLNGDADSQVQTKELDLFKIAAPHGEYKILEKTNHVLKIVDDDKQNIEAYTNPSYQLNPELGETIYQFIKNHQ